MSDTAQLTRTVDGVEFPNEGRYSLDLAHTVVGFVARHLMVAKVRGHFTEFAGTIDIAARPEDSSAEVTIQAASVTTGDDGRDNHLRSADFFDAEKNATITFKSTGVSKRGADWSLSGDLTINGVTKPVTLDAEFNGAMRDPWGGTRIGFSAWTEITREDFNVNFNAPLDGGGVLVGSKVRIEIEAEAKLEA